MDRIGKYGLPDEQIIQQFFGKLKGEVEYNLDFSIKHNNYVERANGYLEVNFNAYLEPFQASFYTDNYELEDINKLENWVKDNQEMTISIYKKIEADFKGDVEYFENHVGEYELEVGIYINEFVYLFKQDSFKVSVTYG